MDCRSDQSVELVSTVKHTFIHARLSQDDAREPRRARTTSDLLALLPDEDPHRLSWQCFGTRCQTKPEAMKHLLTNWDRETSAGDSERELPDSISSCSDNSSNCGSSTHCEDSGSAHATPPGSFSSQLPGAPTAFSLGVSTFHLVPVMCALRALTQRSVAVSPRDAGQTRGTTVILKNLPAVLSRDELLRVLDAEGFGGLYDFLYLPTNMSNGGSYCYGFINMVSHEAALRFFAQMQGFSAWPNDAGRPMKVLWSDIQGQETYIKKYRNSTVMHESVPEHCKPALFRGGCRVPFPAPTQRIKAPRLRDRAPAAKLVVVGAC